MTSSIKISDKSKKILDRIQAKITLSTEKKATLQEIIDLIMDYVDRNEDIIIKEPKEKKHPLTEEEIKRLRNFPWDFGVVTKEEDIDNILYGE